MSLPRGWVESTTVSTHRSIEPLEEDPGLDAPEMSAESKDRVVRERRVFMDNATAVTEESEEGSGAGTADEHPKLA